MKVWLLCIMAILSWAHTQGQQFDVLTSPELVKAVIGENVQSHIRVRNNETKTITLIIKKLSNTSLGSTQRIQLCTGNFCGEEITLKLEPGQTSNDVALSFDAGLAAGLSSSRLIIQNKSNPAEAVELEVNYLVEEFAERRTAYDSKYITLHDAYPNPAVEVATIDYKIHQQEATFAITVRNLIGNVVGKYPLSFSENKLRIRTEDLNPGIYFFTLYIDGHDVLTRKMMVRK